MGILNTVKNKFQDAIGEKSGVTSGEEQAGLRDVKPYATYYNNGMFRRT